MISVEDIEVFLPKYLSPEAEADLFEDLKQFPSNINKRLYSSRLTNHENIFQGDGVRDLLFINLPETKIDKVRAMVLSNTCDASPQNKRLYSPNILYAPILNLKRYESVLLEANEDQKQVIAHIDSIRKQKITSVFYLPIGGSLDEESIVFLDRINNCSIDYFDGKNIPGIRLFTLSDYGLYLFLFKLSVHFTRIREGIERGTDTFLSN